MSKEYEGQDPMAIAQQAERDLNSNAAKTGHGNENTSVNPRHGASTSDSSTHISDLLEDIKGCVLTDS